MNVENQTIGLSFKNVLKESSRFGFRVVKLFVLIFFSIGFINFLFQAVAVYNYLGLDKTSTHLMCLIATFVVGLLFITIAFYFTYKYLIIDTFRLIYGFLTPFFQYISEKIVNSALAGKINLNNPHIEKAFNWGGLLGEMYGKSVPGYVKKIINFGINQIPLADLILKLKPVLQKENEQQASKMLHKEIDDYIVNSIFKKNTFAWIYWLVPLNMLIQILLIWQLN